MALSAEGFPAFYDRTEPLLRLARQRPVGPDRRRTGHGGARGRGQRSGAVRGYRRQPPEAFHCLRQRNLCLFRQSVKTTEAGGPSGYDAGKKVKGRKRHLAVDTLGLPIACHVTPADVQDRDALPPLLEAVHQKSPWVEVAFVDGGYSGDETQRAAFEASRIRVTVVKRSDRSVKGFVVLPKRWIVERTLGWLNRSRRLAKDFEATLESSRAWVMLAIGFLLLRRAARNGQAAA